MWQTAVPQCYIFALTFAQSMNKVPPLQFEAEIKVLRWKWKPFTALEYICSQISIHMHASQHSSSARRWQKALPLIALAPASSLPKLTESPGLLLSQSSWDHMPGCTVQWDSNFSFFTSLGYKHNYHSKNCYFLRAHWQRKMKGFFFF